MPLLTDVYIDPGGNTTLDAYFAQIRQILNNLDNDNVRVKAGIETSKIQDGTMFSTHASRHATGGSDPMGKSSISGYMIQPRAIASHHIGVEAVLGSHIAPGAITDGSYRDTAPVSYSHGDVINAPTGYENSKMDVLLAGFQLDPNVADNTPQMPIKVYVAAGEAVVCTCKAIDSNLDELQVDATGNVWVIRRCWP